MLLTRRAALAAAISLCGFNALPSASTAQSRANAAVSTQPILIEAAASAQTVNVMGRTLPALPTMPTLTRKPGIVRGYVYDSNGKPLKGAQIGVRSTIAGGFYSGAAAETDAKGYYEIKPPVGVAHFYCAGYAVDYGDGIAAVGLHPADGEVGSFATSTGEVENFVLLPYGITNRADVQDNPGYAGNYYGGSLYVSWWVNESGENGNPRNLPDKVQVEITLTPDGALIDGSPGRTIIVRKPVNGSVNTGVKINNIPIGRYKIAAKIVGAGPLRMRETAVSADTPFGLQPREATGAAALLFRPDSAKAGLTIAAHGNWKSVQILLERP